MSDRPKRNRKKSQKQNDADASDQHLQDDDDELLFITIGNYEYDISEVQEWPIEIYDETLSAEFKTIYVLAEGTDYVYWVLTELDGLDEVWEVIPNVLSQKQEQLVSVFLEQPQSLQTLKMKEMKKMKRLLTLKILTLKR